MGRYSDGVDRRLWRQGLPQHSEAIIEFLKVYHPSAEQNRRAGKNKEGLADLNRLVSEALFWRSGGVDTRIFSFHDYRAVEFSLNTVLGKELYEKFGVKFRGEVGEDATRIINANMVENGPFRYAGHSMSPPEFDTVFNAVNKTYAELHFIAIANIVSDNRLIDPGLLRPLLKLALAGNLIVGFDSNNRAIVMIMSEGFEKVHD
jgi:hypothetical protein